MEEINERREGKRMNEREREVKIERWGREREGGRERRRIQERN